MANRHLSANEFFAFYEIYFALKLFSCVVITSIIITLFNEFQTLMRTRLLRITVCFYFIIPPHYVSLLSISVFMFCFFIKVAYCIFLSIVKMCFERFDLYFNFLCFTYIFTYLFIFLFFYYFLAHFLETLSRSVLKHNNFEMEFNAVVPDI